VLARPIGRAQIVLGKLLGLSALLAVYTLVLYGCVLLVAWSAAHAALPDAPAVLALLVLQPLILVAATVFGSTFLPTLANGAAAILLYGVAAFGGALEQITAFAGVHALSDVGIITSLLLPADAIYRRAAALAAQGQAGGLLWRMAGPASGAATPSPAMVWYAVLYVVAAVGGAVWIFTRRDV
jgi:Cu-processing system permease protein